MKMKKMLALALTAVLALSLCGCQQGLETLKKLEDIELPPLPEVTDAASQENEPAQNGQETGGQVQVFEQGEGDGGPVTVRFQQTGREEYDPENGTQLILTFSYETPYVTIRENGEAAQKINDYAAMLDETFYTGNDYGAGEALGFNAMLEMAQDNYAYAVNSGLEMGLEYSAYSSVSVARADSAVVSFVYDEQFYTGGAHGNYSTRGYVFNARTGDLLSLQDLSGDYAALSAFLTEYMVKAVENDSELAQRIDYALLEGKSNAEIFAGLLRDGSWYLNGEGMVIFSDLYEISSYAAGPIEFTVPYDLLAGVIDAGWLPEEKTGEGSLEAVAMDQVEDGTVEIVDFVNAGEGDSLCLLVQGTVYDVEITRVQYAGSFYETGSLWYAGRLSGCAVQLQAPLPEGMPELMIRYTSGGERVTRLLSHGEDGGPALVDDSIQPVG